MNPAINIDTKYHSILDSILEPISTELYAFGSRVKGGAQKFSDLDLCFKGDFDKALIRKIKEDLRNSNLPIKVDLISYNDASSEFQELIDSEMVNYHQV